MRILFVAMSGSVHSARWINQVSDRDWDIHLFSSVAAPPHPQLENTTVHEFTTFEAVSRRVLQRCRCATRRGLSRVKSKLLGRKVAPNVAPSQVAAPAVDFAAGSSGTVRTRTWTGGLRAPGIDPAAQLAKVIARIRPDVVHSMEIQHGGYLTHAASLLRGNRMPPWVISNWGSDIYLFGRDPNHAAEHAPKIRAALAAADYYGCECRRDQPLGDEFGFTGRKWPVIPAAGGYRLDEMQRHRMPGPTSARRVVALKGYENWAGRALTALRAMRQCVAELRGYELHVYNAYHHPEVQRAAKELAAATGIALTLLPYSSHEDMLRLHGRARVSIGLSISDGISTSFLEALVMGSFPIQTHTACADEWIDDGVSGSLVPPGDADAVARALRRALTDDALVDRAAELNAETARRRLDYGMIQRQVVGLYEEIAAQRKSPRNVVA